MQSSFSFPILLNLTDIISDTLETSTYFILSTKGVIFTDLLVDSTIYMPNCIPS